MVGATGYPDHVLGEETKKLAQIFKFEMVGGVSVTVEFDGIAVAAV